MLSSKIETETYLCITVFRFLANCKTACARFDSFVKVSDQPRLRSFWAKRIAKLQPVNAPQHAEIILTASFSGVASAGPGAALPMENTLLGIYIRG
jgi:hypothetical protein